MDTRDILYKGCLSKDDVKLLIRRTFEIYGKTDEEKLLSDAMVAMVDTTPLIFCIRHLFRFYQSGEWEFAAVFEDDPHFFNECLEKGDMTLYYAKYPASRGQRKLHTDY